MNAHIAPLSIPALAARISARELTVEHLITDTLARIHRLNPVLNAYITVLDEGALDTARRLDAELAAGRPRGPLHGIPISVKDLVDVEGTPTTAGSRVRVGHVAPADAPVVARLREAGAVIVGKTNLHEFAYGTTSEDSAYGPVRNAWDTTRLAGGSSGGSATAIAAGLCAASIGTDTGGSIRIPSAACGVVGLKPTYAEVSADAVVPLSWSLDHVGPMAADVESVRVLYEAMIGALRLAPAQGARTGQAGEAIQDLRLGVPRRYFLDLLDTEVRAHFEAVLGRLRENGATIVDVDIAHADLVAAVYLHIQLPESSCYHATTLERHQELYLPSVRQRLEMGRYVLAEDYVRAQRGRETLRQEVDAALSTVQALALPSLAIPAPPLGQAMVQVERAPAIGATCSNTGLRISVEMPVRAIMLRLTQLFNVTGHPAISMPMGRTTTNLPTGLQLVGGRHETPALLDCAARVERTLLNANGGVT
jgi:aspartyl-tRNA(Asn)/glutamyl-tRNA(Gln) amidotransferase subunit A